MTSEWTNLPLLPLRCALEYLSVEDALAAMSTCRHWRNAMLLYEGCKETLKLEAKQFDKSLFLTRIFRKHTKRLHIYIDCNQQELEMFITHILPQFFDAMKLHEILFIGPKYALQKNNVPAAKLMRVITESLVFKHLHCLQKLAILGCEMECVKNDNDQYVHKNVEYYSRPLTFSESPLPADAILSRSNSHMMLFSAIKHIILDYKNVSTESLETLSHLNQFSQLTMNIHGSKDNLVPVDWSRLDTRFPSGLDVAVNIIGVPARSLEEVMDNVLLDGVNLVSLKIIFCNTLYYPLLIHAVNLYKSSLRELLWCDSPHGGSLMSQTIDFDACNVNPFILLCWQCKRLKRLVIHGYWIWSYDLIGIVRLRELEELEVSAVFGDVTTDTAQSIDRVLTSDVEPTLPTRLVNQMRQYTKNNWRPLPWSKLHPALKPNSYPRERAEYIVGEITRSLGVA